MDRRTALGTIGGGLALALSGCQQYERLAPSDTTAQGSDASLNVTKRVEHGQTDLERVLRIEDGGHLTVELTCQDGSTKSAETDLPDDDWTEFEALVLESDVTGFASEYECSGDCPQDVPPTQLTFEIDGESTEVVVEPTADLPSDLDRILTEIESFEERIDSPTCG